MKDVIVKIAEEKKKQKMSAAQKGAGIGAGLGGVAAQQTWKYSKGEMPTKHRIAATAASAAINGGIGATVGAGAGKLVEKAKNALKKKDAKDA